MFRFIIIITLSLLFAYVSSALSKRHHTIQPRAGLRFVANLWLPRAPKFADDKEENLELNLQLEELLRNCNQTRRSTKSQSVAQCIRQKNGIKMVLLSL